MEGADEWRVLGFRGLEGRWARSGDYRSGDDRPTQDRPAAQDVLVAGLAVQVRRAVRVGLVVCRLIGWQFKPRLAVQDRLAVHAVCTDARQLESRRPQEGRCGAAVWGRWCGWRDKGDVCTSSVRSEPQQRQGWQRHASRVCPVRASASARCECKCALRHGLRRTVSNDITAQRPKSNPVSLGVTHNAGP